MCNAQVERRVVQKFNQVHRATQQLDKLPVHWLPCFLVWKLEMTLHLFMYIVHSLYIYIKCFYSLNPKATRCFFRKLNMELMEMGGAPTALNRHHLLIRHPPKLTNFYSLIQLLHIFFFCFSCLFMSFFSLFGFRIAVNCVTLAKNHPI